MADIQVVGVEPTAFKQLLRYIYTGSCAEGALEAMADHLYEAADRFGVPELQQLAARQMTASLDAEKVCDYFALAHAHEDDMLMDGCAALVAQQMYAVTQTAGFRRMAAENHSLVALLMENVGALSSPEAQLMRNKRKRGGGYDHVGGRTVGHDGSGGSGDGGGGGGGGGSGGGCGSSERVKRLKVSELRGELASLGLPTDGVKSDLAARLEEAATVALLQAVVALPSPKKPDPS